MSNSSYGPHCGQPEGAMMSASADDTTVPRDAQRDNLKQIMKQKVTMNAMR
jgi:hypothetical protein